MNNTNDKNKKTGTKFKVLVYSAITFFILSNPVTYKFTNELWAYMMNSNNELLSESGLPTLKGTILHAFIFMLVISIFLY